MRGIQLALAALLVLGACTQGQKASDRYAGPGVDRGPDMASQLADLVIIDKSERMLLLYSKGHRIGHYPVKLGFSPDGHKVAEGDGRTPEGLYTIDRRNPASKFHLSLGISYPNARDMARAMKQGVDPGGDIFIHGQPNGVRSLLSYDWTEGCIAVSDDAIREIWSRVPTGTPIQIRA